MIKVFDISFGYHPDISAPEQVPVLHRGGLGYAHFFSDQVDITKIEHINYEGELKLDGVKYRFFRTSGGFFHTYRKTIQYIKKEQPDILFVQGLLFPFQVIILRLLAGKKTRIIVQHHGERPFKTVKRWVQRIADRYIDAYVFTTLGNAEPWIQEGMIRDRRKCREILEGSTDIKKLEKETCREKLQISGSPLILWVGRLNNNKDPLTVLRGFKKFVEKVNTARLYMVFQEEDLVNEVKSFIRENNLMKNIQLVGNISHGTIENWYSSADLFISGSHGEGSGFALLEAMACGCAPVVSAIPSFKKITGEGQFGFLFETGNENSLFETLMKTREIDMVLFSERIRENFNKELSFASIAEKLHSLFVQLKPE